MSIKYLLILVLLHYRTFHCLYVIVLFSAHFSNLLRSFYFISAFQSKCLLSTNLIIFHPILHLNQWWKYRRVEDIRLNFSIYLSIIWRGAVDENLLSGISDPLHIDLIAMSLTSLLISMSWILLKMLYRNKEVVWQYMKEFI